MIDKTDSARSSGGSEQASRSVDRVALQEAPWQGKAGITEAPPLSRLGAGVIRGSSPDFRNLSLLP